jgi:serine/threonine protein kinase
VTCASDNPGGLCVDLDETVFEKLVQRPLPNVVRIRETWKEQILAEKFCIRMDYIGNTLKALLEQGNTYVGLFWFDIMAPLANGLLQAHQCDIIHGDLRPQNGIPNSMTLMTDKVRVEIDHVRGTIAEDKVYISDFGIRHWWLNTKNGLKTPGTKQYLAPEVYAGGPDKLSEASDVWALGCIGYEIFTGVRLFDSERAIERYAYNGELADPTQVQAIQRSHPDIFSCIAGCLYTDPAKRWGVGYLLDVIRNGRTRRRSDNRLPIFGSS